MPAIIFSFLDKSNHLARDFVQANYGNSSPYLRTEVNKYLAESSERQRFMPEEEVKGDIPKDIANYSMMMPPADGAGTDFWEETETGYVRYHCKARSAGFQAGDLDEKELSGKRTTIMRLGTEVHILHDDFKEEDSTFATENLWTGITFLEKKGESAGGKEEEKQEKEEVKAEKKKKGFEWDDREKMKMEIPLEKYLEAREGKLLYHLITTVDDVAIVMEAADVE